MSYDSKFCSLRRASAERVVPGKSVGLAVTARTLLQDKGDALKGERGEGRFQRPKKGQRLRQRRRRILLAPTSGPEPQGRNPRLGSLIRV